MRGQRLEVWDLNSERPEIGCLDLNSERSGTGGLGPKQ